MIVNIAAAANKGGNAGGDDDDEKKRQLIVEGGGATMKGKAYNLLTGCGRAGHHCVARVLHE